MPDELTPTPEATPTPATPSLINQDNPPPVDPNAPPADPNEPKKEEPVAPEPLTVESFSIPEGFESASDEIKTKFVDILNDQKMSQKDRAQALVDLQADVLRETSEKIFETWRETQTKWQEEVRNDPELGGAKMSENLAGISKLFETYGAKADANADTKAAQIEELRKAMDYTGAGNNPTIIRFLHRIAKELNEPAPVSGTPASQSSSEPGSRLYPTMAKS